MNAADLVLDAGALAALDEAVGPESAVTVMDIILGSFPKLCAQLRAAASAGNLGDVARAAHQLKSECGHVGGIALGARLQDLETCAGEGRLEQPAAEVARLSPMIEKFLEHLRGVRNSRARWVRP